MTTCPYCGAPARLAFWAARCCDPLSNDLADDEREQYPATAVSV